MELSKSSWFPPHSIIQNIALLQLAFRLSLARGLVFLVFQTGDEFRERALRATKLQWLVCLGSRRLACGHDLTRKIHDFRNTEGLAMVQIRYPGGFETKSEAFT
jgi:hypothetical protein